MAEPIDTATLLEDVSGIVRTKYMPSFYEQGGGRFGSTTNRLFQVSGEACGGDGVTMQGELGPADTIRMGTNMIVDFDSVGVLRETSVRLRANTQNPALNDFTAFRGSVQFADITIANGSMGSAIDIAKRTFNYVTKDYDEKKALGRNMSRNGVVGLVNGTPNLNNGVRIGTGTGAASSTATNSGGLRCAVDGGIFAGLKENQFIDFLNPSTGAVRAGSVRITDTNSTDYSVGVEFVSTQIGSRVSTGNLANVADNDLIVHSGNYNAGMYSLGEWFRTPAAGEPFIGGVDRTTAAYRWMIPLNPRYGATGAKIAKSMFDDVATSLGYRFEEEQAGLVCQTDMRLSQALRTELGEESFIQITDKDERYKKFYNFGSSGLNYQHPSLGIVKVIADALCPENTVRFINPSTWLSKYYAFKGLKMMEGIKGGWNRVSQSTPNTGPSTIWKCDWYSVEQDFCTAPKKNAQISNVTAT